MTLLMLASSPLDRRSCKLHHNYKSNSNTNESGMETFRHFTWVAVIGEI